MNLSDEVLAELQSDLKSVVENEVKDDITEIFHQTVQRHWYDDFEKWYGYDKPKRYKRRYDNGGLLDPSLVATEVTKSGTNTMSAEFVSNIKTNPYDLNEDTDDLLEAIDKYGDGVYPSRARDLMAMTEEELDKYNIIEDAIAFGLRLRGYDVSK